MLQSELMDDILLSVEDSVLSFSSELSERKILSVLIYVRFCSLIFIESDLLKSVSLYVDAMISLYIALPTLSV